MAKAFSTAHRWDMEWQDATGVLALGEGVQVVRGEHLRPGDSVSGPSQVPHGLFEYPEGCVVFASFRGGSALHRYPGSPAGDI